MENQSTDHLLSEKEAALRLGVSRPTLLRLRQRGEIGFFRVATRVLFSEAHLQEFLSRAERLPRVTSRTRAHAKAS